MRLAMMIATAWLGFFLPQQPGAQNVNILADSAAGFQNDPIVTPVRVRNFNGILSMQGSIVFDTTVITFDSLGNYGLPSMSIGNFGTTMVGSGTLTYSWSHPGLTPTTVPDDSVIFTMHFTLVGNPGDTSHVRFTGSPTALEFVDSTFGTIPFDTTAGRITVADTSTPVFQELDLQFHSNVYPNPSDGVFYVPTGICADTKIRMFDALGKEWNWKQYALPMQDRIQINLDERAKSQSAIWFVQTTCGEATNTYKILTHR